MQLVSVIIPTYNRAHSIAQAINSVLEQSYPATEILVVDDGSTDNTADVLKAFGDRVRYLYKPNGGVSSARNHGIVHSRGEFLAFLDSDDCWLPSKLERQVSFLNQREGFGLVLCDIEFVDPAGNSLGRSERRKVLPRDGQLLAEVLLAPSLIPSTVLVDRKLIQQVGGFDEGLKTAEDFDLHLKLARMTQIGLIDEPLVRYMRGHDSLSMLACTYDDHVYVISRFIAANLDVIPGWLQQRALFNTYYEAATGKFWLGELMPGVRYAAAANRIAVSADWGALARLWLRGGKCFLKQLVKGRCAS